MSHQDSYIWTIGYRDNGSPIIGGPFTDMEDAQDGTAHLSRVQYVRLGTRDRNAAIPQLRDRIQAHSSNGRAREPVGAGPGVKSRIINRILHRKKEAEDDDTSPS